MAIVKLCQLNKLTKNTVTMTLLITVRMKQNTLELIKSKSRVKHYILNSQRVKFQLESEYMKIHTLNCGRKNEKVNDHRSYKRN